MMMPIDLRPAVLRQVSIYCEDRGEAVEAIKSVAEALSSAGASWTEQRQFWQSLKADFKGVRRSILEGHLRATLNPTNAVLKAALEEIVRQERKLEGLAGLARFG